MTTTTVVEVDSKPFYVALLELITKASSDCEHVAHFIASTDIPREHCAAISQVWQDRYRGMGDKDFYGVPSVLEKKMVVGLPTSEVALKDVEVGRKFWDSEGPRSELLFQRTTEEEFTCLAGKYRGEISLTRHFLDWKVQMVIEG